MRKTSYVTVSDHFAGAGGNTVGILRAGAEVKIAINHNDDAISTYGANHPDIDLDKADLLDVDPRRYARTDILVASPECTWHADANGRKKPGPQRGFFDEPEDPAAERSRMTMWDVPRFTAVHRYEIVIVENVVRVRNWRDFGTWLDDMHKLGYEHRELYLNAMFFHPTPQSRDRIYIVFWKKGNRRPALDYHPRAYCTRCERDVDAVQSWKNPHRRYGKYGKRNQYLYRCPTCTSEVTPYYYCAWNVIDWKLPCPKVGERTPPLAGPAKARIEAGIRKYAGDRAFLFPVTHGKDDVRFRSLDEAFPTQTARQTEALAVPEPFVVENHGNSTASPMTDALATVCASAGHNFVAVPPPFLVAHFGERPTQAPRTHALEAALPTVTSRGAAELVTPSPFLVANYGGVDGGPVTDALRTVTTVDHNALAVPPAFLASYYQTLNLHTLDEPVATVPTVDRHALVSLGERIDVEDCGYRMLEPHELQKAQGFPVDYRILGSKRTRVWLIGNANPPETMAWIIGRCVETLR